jgi:hypothetical protein
MKVDPQDFQASICSGSDLETVPSAFMKTGIYPTDSNIFVDADFLASEIRDGPSHHHHLLSWALCSVINQLQNLPLPPTLP